MMNLLTCLIMVFVLAWCPALIAEDSAAQTFSIQEAHLNLPLPNDWIKMPERALDRFRRNADSIAPSIKSSYVAGFAGPRPPANSPLTLLIVQVFPRDLRPEDFLSSLLAIQQSLARAKPDWKPEQSAPYIDSEIRAVVVPGRTPQGTSGRSYTIPTSQGVIVLDLYCPTEAAVRIFPTVESCLRKISFADGVELNRKWLDDFRSSSKTK